LGFEDIIIKSYHVIHTSTQHQLDNNIHVPLNHNENKKYDEKNNYKKSCNEDHITKQLDKNKIRRERY
jgi:hypothetical protein